jgi:hypothetical protein
MHDNARKHVSRRAMLGALSAVGGAAIAGACGSASASPTSPTDSTSTTIYPGWYPFTTGRG